MDKLDEELFRTIFNNQTFGRDRSAKIVGGLSRLMRLVGSGDIRAEKKSKTQNGKWYCNAYDVIRNAKI